MNTQKILEATAGRDRPTDLVKASALLLVTIGHGLAWNITPGGTIQNTLDAIPNLFWISWILQILPLFFFLAGTQLGSLRAAKSDKFAKRTLRLTTDTLTLYLIAAVIAAGAGLIDTSYAKTFGLLAVQLTWFVGVYLAILATGPLLARLRLKHIGMLFALIVAVDLIRIHALAFGGWANMYLVWAFFAAAGVHKETLWKLPTAAKATIAGIAGGSAVLLVIYGPYSRALITVESGPGLSNLAPPTTVLTLAGLCQIMLLSLIWPTLRKATEQNKIWIPTAVFAGAAMQIYLYHMILLSVIVGLLTTSGFGPQAASLVWWVVHIVVWALVITLVFLLAKPLAALSRKLNSALIKPFGQRALTAQASTYRAALGVTAVVVLLIASGGVNDLFTLRSVIGIPYIPAAALGIVAGVNIWSALICRKPHQNSSS